MEIAEYGRFERFDNTEYPSYIERVAMTYYESTMPGTYYGMADKPIMVSGNWVPAYHVFSLGCNFIGINAKEEANLVVMARLGYRGQSIFGVQVEREGRLEYIDGCTDSILIYPPRMGDPCINHLQFPPGIDQTFHTHPSIRLGYVMRGRGYACLNGQERELKKGDIFCLDIDEVHRFRTTDESMSIIAYHPDSDWGPTDKNHPMINRTIIDPNEKLLRMQYSGMMG